MHTSTHALAAVGVAVLLCGPAPLCAQTGPNLAMAVHHTGNFTVGQSGVYTIVVSNNGGTPSSGEIDVDDGLTGPGLFRPLREGVGPAGWWATRFRSHCAAPQVRYQQADRLPRSR